MRRQNLGSARGSIHNPEELGLTSNASHSRWAAHHIFEDEAQHMSSRSNWPTLYHSLWFVLALAVVVWQAPGFIRSLYPPRTITFDFYQDWASARNFLNGEPIYADISLTIERYLGWRLPENWSPWYWRVNTHPPPSVLITLPFAWLDYPEAFLLWNLLSLAALAATFWLMARQFAIRISAWSLLSIIALLLVWYPFRQQMTQGQINLVLLLMLTVIWAAHRSAWFWTAGAVLGAATAVKLFPGLLFVYFVLRRQWKVAASSAATLIVITVVSALVLGSQTYYAYVVDVLPASDQWQSHWHNTSLMAFWTKLFDPAPAGGAIIPIWRSPVLARVGGWLSCAVVVAILMWAILRARTPSDHDLAFGLTVTAMLLVSPITWSQNLVLLIVPLTLMWMHLPLSRPARWAWMLIVLTLFVPPPRVWQLLIPGGWPDGTVSPLQTLTALSFHCYAVLGLFALQLVRGGVTPQPSTVGSSDRQRVLPLVSAAAHRQYDQ